MSITYGIDAIENALGDHRSILDDTVNINISVNT